MHIWKSYIRTKKLDVQETNICLTQFNGSSDYFSDAGLVIEVFHSPEPTKEVQR